MLRLFVSGGRVEVWRVPRITLWGTAFDWCNRLFRGFFLTGDRHGQNFIALRTANFFSGKYGLQREDVSTKTT